MKRKSLVLGFVAGFLYSGSAQARQPESSEDPEALIRTGVNLRHAGDDVRAEGYFRRAYHIARTPRSAIQLGLVEYALKNYASAEMHMSEGLRSDDAWVTSHRAVLEKTLTDLRQYLAGVEISGAPAEATVTTGRLGPIKVTDKQTLWLTPGAVALKIDAPGYASETYELKVMAGKTSKVAVKMRRDAPGGAAAGSNEGTTATGASTSETGASVTTNSSDTPTPYGNRTLRTAGLITAAAGLLAGGTGIFLYQTGTSKRQSIENAAMNRTPYNESDGNWKTYDRAGLGFMIGGGAMIVTGTVLYLVGRKARPTSFETTASLHLSPGFGSVQVGGRF